MFTTNLNFTTVSSRRKLLEKTRTIEEFLFVQVEEGGGLAAHYVHTT